MIMFHGIKMCLFMFVEFIVFMIIFSTETLFIVEKMLESSILRVGFTLINYCTFPQIHILEWKFSRKIIS